MDGRRFWNGFGWGVVATIAMSALMIAGVLTGTAPMPKPIPAAIVGKLTGGSLPQTATMALGVALHLGYGGLWGGAFAALTRRVTLWRGIAMGVGLWLIMQVAVLPFLGWGLFGTAQTPKIAIATLVLHLVYGATYGWLMDRVHPMHLHGHFSPVRNALKETVIVPPHMRQVTFDFTAENAGDSFFHCHNLYQTEAAMARVFQVA